MELSRTPGGFGSIIETELQICRVVLFPSTLPVRLRDLVRGGDHFSSERDTRHLTVRLSRSTSDSAVDTQEVYSEVLHFLSAAS